MHYIGIDIGGTSIKAGRTDASGSILRTAIGPTPIADLEELISNLSGLIRSLIDESGIAGIGIGIPGLRNARTAVLETSPHLPCLRGVNLEERLRDLFQIPVVSENDANAAAYGEAVCGAGKGLEHMAYITLGTGLGCGLVLSRELFRGHSGFAGELGHTVIEADGRPCACGARGCLETRVSATGIVQTAQEAHVSGDISSAEAIYNEAIRGNRAARAVFEETGRYLGKACANLMNLLNPQAIVVGGGVMASGELLLKAARDEAALHAFAPSARDCPIVQSQLWPDAGTIGAAMLARDIS
jgi:glucokinase